MTTTTLAAASNNFLLPNATFVVELILFLLVLWIFYRFIVPPLAKAMRERDDMVRRQVEDSEEAARLLRQAEERFDSALAEARAEAGRIRDEARAEANRVREEMREKADTEVERIRQQGAEQLAEQHDQTVRQLRTEIGGLSTKLAERIIGESVSGARNRSTVDRFLADLESRETDGSTGRSTTAAGGGTN